MLKYEKINLFDKKDKVILVHAVNCKGMMGSGIAKEFKQRFPEAFQMYHEDCEGFGDEMLGKAVVYYDKKKKDIGKAVVYYDKKKKDIGMGCLFTSRGYGKFVDSPTQILQSTKLAVTELLRISQEQVEDFGAKIYSNKFNSGLFNVPWKKSEAIIVEALKVYPAIDWTVCDPF